MRSEAGDVSVLQTLIPRLASINPDKRSGSAPPQPDVTEQSAERSEDSAETPLKKKRHPVKLTESGMRGMIYSSVSSVCRRVALLGWSPQDVADPPSDQQGAQKRPEHDRNDRSY